jgi:acyl carrier protein
MNESILEDVRRTAADVLRQPLDRVTASASRDSVPGWDSLAHVNLVLALEQQFDLQFLPEEMMEMLSVELIAMLIEEKLAAGRGGALR